MSSQRHQQHLSSYMKARKSSPSEYTSNQSPSERSLRSDAFKSAARKNLNTEKTAKTQPRPKIKQEYRVKPAKNVDNINRTLWEGIFPRFPLELRKLFTFEETKADSFDWKKEIIKRSIKARKSKFLCTKKNFNPYTGLSADVQKKLKALAIEWKLCFTDTRGQNHWATANETTHFSSSLSTRWLSLQLPPLIQLNEMKVFASVPVFFDKSWKPHTKSATTSSLLINYDLKARGTTIMKEKADAEGDMISAHFLPPGLLITCWTASWKDGGELAFVTACFSYHHLLERIMLGTSTMIYKAPTCKPIFDDIDSQYGLHGYSAMVELRNHKSSYWSQQFRELYHNGFTSDFVVLRGLGNEYGVFYKRLSLPWKTELFRNILQNACFFDMTMLDEHRRPIWCVSSPVIIHKNNETHVNYSAEDGECFYIEYCDDKGSVHMDIVWNSSEEQTRVADVEFRIRKSFINSWFGTSY